MELKIKKIDECEKINSEVQAQGCSDDCKETNVWVGRSSGKEGCVLYNVAYTARTVVFW